MATTDPDLLAGVLDEWPDFRHKLRNFCCDYALHAKPALILQSRPSQPLELDVKSKALVDAIEAATGNQVDRDGWWYGFHAGRRPVPVFDGLAAYSQEDEQGWMTESHSDGHVIGGLWVFPESRAREVETILQISDFHTRVFSDFAALTANIWAAGEVEYPGHVTCSLLNAQKLRFGRERFPFYSRELRRNVLQWRVREVAGPQALADALRLMGDELLRAFGQVHR